MPSRPTNRDPEAFPDADRVIIDRAENRHLAFGVGIHRCAGSKLARRELRVALEEWLARIPDFELEDPSAVTWVGGQVRGPRCLPLVFPADGRNSSFHEEGQSPARPLPGPRPLLQHRPGALDVDDYGNAFERGDGTILDELVEKAQLAIQNCPEYAVEFIEE